MHSITMSIRALRLLVQELSNGGNGDYVVCTLDNSKIEIFDD
jgi:hypothetical protein